MRRARASVLCLFAFVGVLGSLAAGPCAFAQLVSGRVPAGSSVSSVSSVSSASSPRASSLPDTIPTRPTLAREIAVLRVLDKISARTTTLRVPVGGSAAFGLMVMTVKSCQVAPPSEAPEAAAFLEIGEMDVNAPSRDEGQGGGRTHPSLSKRLLFSGWMFASSPALSALEHPVYDVTVMACEAKDAPVPPAPASPAPDATAGAGTPKKNAPPASESPPTTPED